ncbi:MAG: HAD family phosphatase [Rikenellaceae bacterium]
MKGILEEYGNIDAIIFDLGNVLLDIDIQRSIDAFMALNIVGLKPEDVFPSPLKIFKDYETGKVSTMQFFDFFKEKYGVKNVEEENFWAAWNVLLNNFDPKRIELLQKLGKNHDLYLLSNTNAEHVRFIGEMFRKQFKYEFCSLFKRCFYSNEVKCRKPDAEIYQKLIDQTGIIPEKSLFIDDLEANVIGARRCGINSYCLKQNETILDIF